MWPLQLSNEDTELERVFSFYRGYWADWERGEMPQDPNQEVQEAAEEMEEEEPENDELCVDPQDAYECEADDGLDELEDHDLALKLGASTCAKSPEPQPAAELVQPKISKLPAFQDGQAGVSQARLERQARIEALKKLGLDPHLLT